MDGGASSPGSARREFIATTSTGASCGAATWAGNMHQWGYHLYVPNRNADVFVMKAGPRFDLLAVNSIGGEPMNASLAVSDGDIFRAHGQESLVHWCAAALSQPARNSRPAEMLTS